MKLNIPVANFICQIITSNKKQVYQIKRHFQTKSGKSHPDKILYIQPIEGEKGYYFSARGNNQVIFYYPSKNNNYDFLYCLRCVIAASFIDNGLIYMHASAVLKNNKIVLFMGKSGSGKSTAARLSRREIFSEDEVFIRIEKQGFVVYSSPFEKDKLKAFKGNGYLLDTIYTLKKSKKPQIKKINNSLIQLKRILSINIYNKNFLDYNHWQELNNKSLLEQLINRVKIKRLLFTKYKLLKI